MFITGGLACWSACQCHETPSRFKVRTLDSNCWVIFSSRTQQLLGQKKTLDARHRSLEAIGPSVENESDLLEHSKYYDDHEFNCVLQKFIVK